MLLAVTGMLQQLPLAWHPSAVSGSRLPPPASEALKQPWQPCNDRPELQGTMLPVTLGALALSESIAWSLLLLLQRLFCPEKDLTLHKRELGVT